MKMKYRHPGILPDIGRVVCPNPDKSERRQAGQFARVTRMVHCPLLKLQIGDKVFNPDLAHRVEVLLEKLAIMRDLPL
jgi:hypothetical protein